jgi:hypothetical protein
MAWRALVEITVGDFWKAADPDVGRNAFPGNIYTPEEEEAGSI